MGRCGYGDKNDRGEQLLEFATKRTFFVCTQDSSKKKTGSGLGWRQTENIQA